MLLSTYILGLHYHSAATAKVVEQCWHLLHHQTADAKFHCVVQWCAVPVLRALYVATRHGHCARAAVHFGLGIEILFKDLEI